jgi:hypothetical protein
VFAEADSIRPEHMVEFWKLLGGGQRDAGWSGTVLVKRGQGEGRPLALSRHWRDGVHGPDTCP